MKLDKLEFASVGAALYMELPSDPQEQGPPGFTEQFHRGFYGNYFKNQIRLPIEMAMEFRGYNSLNELTFVPINIDTVGFLNYFGLRYLRHQYKIR